MIGIFKKKAEPKVIKRFDVSWKLTDVKSMELLFDEAKTRVADTIKDHYEISKKAFAILLVVLSITSVICGFLISQFANEALDKVLVAIAVIAFIFSAFILFFLVNLVRPTKFHPPGREPRKVMTNELFKNDKIEGDNIYKALLYKELVHSQAQIDLNQHINTKRLERLDFVLRLITIVSILLILLTALLKMF